MRAQLAMSRPLAKQLWQRLVVGKIRMQGEALRFAGKEHGAFDLLARKVRSGDPQNVEAQAARRYWKTMFGPEFNRDRGAEGVNALLNYGYTVLRAIASRAVCASGLHPTIGIFHANRVNAFALADDVMEPFRPVVDLVVADIINSGITEVDTDAKRKLAGITTIDLQMADDTVSPLGAAMQKLTHSLAMSFESRTADLVLPLRSVRLAYADDDT
jgi:CRISPR-associated protein Cas1